jgi:hypothetical protein
VTKGKKREKEKKRILEENQSLSFREHLLNFPNKNLKLVPHKLSSRNKKKMSENKKND